MSTPAAPAAPAAPATEVAPPAAEVPPPPPCEEKEEPFQVAQIEPNPYSGDVWSRRKVQQVMNSVDTNERKDLYNKHIKCSMNQGFLLAVVTRFLEQYIFNNPEWRDDYLLSHAVFNLLYARYVLLCMQRMVEFVIGTFTFFFYIAPSLIHLVVDNIFHEYCSTSAHIMALKISASFLSTLHPLVDWYFAYSPSDKEVRFKMHMNMLSATTLVVIYLFLRFRGTIASVRAMLATSNVVQKFCHRSTIRALIKDIPGEFDRNSVECRQLKKEIHAQVSLNRLERKKVVYEVCQNNAHSQVEKTYVEMMNAVKTDVITLVLSTSTHYVPVCVAEYKVLAPIVMSIARAVTLWFQLPDNMDAVNARYIQLLGEPVED